MFFGYALNGNNAMLWPCHLELIKFRDCETTVNKEERNCFFKVGFSCCCQNGGIRAKLRTEDGNDIDTMFVDRRRYMGATQNGTTLVCD